MSVAVDGVSQTFFSHLVSSTRVGNSESQYYTQNRAENSRCELFPGSSNGRLIIEARKVGSKGQGIENTALLPLIRKTMGVTVSRPLV